MSEPRTEAGKRLLDDLFEPGKSDDLGLAGDDPQPWITAITAIEAEARRTGAAEALERVRVAVGELDAAEPSCADCGCEVSYHAECDEGDGLLLSDAIDRAAVLATLSDSSLGGTE